MPDVDPGPPRSVLLTGATGYLGGSLLADLLVRTPAHVHCLVRQRPGRDAHAELAATVTALGVDRAQLGRIHIVDGSLARPRLGMDPATYERLAQEVDAVYHCGAWVNLVVDYSYLRGSNVGGTVEVLRFATHVRRIPVHHVSTLTVLTNAFRTGDSAVGEDRQLPPPVSVGYCQSKWVAEHLVARAAQRGTPVTVHRPAVVLPDSRTGRSAPADWFLLLTAASIRVGCSPDYAFQLPVGTVDYTSRCIVDLSLDPAAAGHAFHVVDPQPMPLGEYFRRVAACGQPLPAVPYEHWLKSVRHVGQDLPVGTLQLAENLPHILPGSQGTAHAATDNLVRLLGSRLRPPTLDQDYFRLLLAQLPSGDRV
ncbi:thioester reductase domain-containing protein [Streptomyces sp. NPDC057137]|uniref:thioester reductase domain-containing protein n=1 Tax=Streptomyces sp. NPDC057137 TaxID=3346030 RepID=UPI0036389722